MRLWKYFLVLLAVCPRSHAGSLEEEKLRKLGYSESFIAKAQSRDHLTREIIRRSSKPVVFFRGIALSEDTAFNPLMKGSDLVTFGTQDFSEAYYYAASAQSAEKNKLVLLQYEVPDYLVERYSGEGAYLSIRDVPHPGMTSKILPGGSSDLAFFVMKKGDFPDQAAYTAAFGKKYKELSAKNGFGNPETKETLMKFAANNVRWAEYQTCSAGFVRILKRLARSK